MLSKVATGRESSFFAADMADFNTVISGRVKGARLLVIGGAGSIGSATIRQLVPFAPGALHVVDVNENGLAELVRDLRGGTAPFEVRDLKTLPLDFGSEILHRFLNSEAPYDYVFNFAALKHVRSEKDIFSVLQMINTNILKQARLLAWLGEKRTPVHYFAVSTDKAANPVNLMGATKKLMEHVLFRCAPKGGNWCVTTARFANVAFSDGSLLYSWIQRLAKGQPVVAPLDTRRFFVSAEESGQICLLAGLLGKDRHIHIPTLNEDEHLRDLREVAREFLLAKGYQPAEYENEQQAKENLARDVARGHYPLLLTALDTSGEKPYEEFAEEGDTVIDAGFSALRAIPYAAAESGDLAGLLEWFEEIVSRPELPVSKQEMVRQISLCLPEFRHIETGKKLDDRF